MPLYEYQCGACHARFELIRKFSDPPVEVCPECGKGPVEKLVSSPAFQFKGTGWYVTDYSRKGEAGKKGEPAAKDGAKSDSAPASSGTADASKASADKPASSAPTPKSD